MIKDIIQSQHQKVLSFDNTMATDGMATQGVPASAVMVLICMLRFFVYR